MHCQKRQLWKWPWIYRWCVDCNSRYRTFDVMGQQKPKGRFIELACLLSFQIVIWNLRIVTDKFGKSGSMNAGNCQKLARKIFRKRLQEHKISCLPIEKIKATTKRYRFMIKHCRLCSYWFSCFQASQHDCVASNAEYLEGCPNEPENCKKIKGFWT